MRITESKLRRIIKEEIINEMKFLNRLGKKVEGGLDAIGSSVAERRGAKEFEKFRGIVSYGPHADAFGNLDDIRNNEVKGFIEMCRAYYGDDLTKELVMILAKLKKAG